MRLAEYAQAFDQVNDDFRTTVEQWGVPFESPENLQAAHRAAAASRSCCHCENGDASLWRNWISPACIACRTGERTATFYVDLRCQRNCYFCFNPNQDNFEYFLSHKRDIAKELEEAHAQGAQFDCLAITGGEPLLHSQEVLDFLKKAQELYPAAHTRLYTNGDLLTEDLLASLAEAGLSEIRFSVKPPDVQGNASAAGQRGNLESWKIWDTIRLAASKIPAVVIELPVIPGTLAWMKELLLLADKAGVKGVNLLEFCFPLHNGQEFKRRNFKLRPKPFKYLYDYWYGGGIPVAHSEEEALELLDFANREGLSLGLHYCSSDNKNTGQIFQQDCSDGAIIYTQNNYPWMTLDPQDHFYKCAKLFGESVPNAVTWLEKNAASFGVTNNGEVVSVPLELTEALIETFPNLEVGISVNVLEEQGHELYLREIAIDPVNP